MLKLITSRLLRGLEQPRCSWTHCSSFSSSTNKNLTSALVPASLFENQRQKTKESFLSAVDMFTLRDKHRRGHVEFIYAALKNMKQFGVHRDLDTYKSIFLVFPQGKFIPTNIYQVEFMHFPKQQQCAIDVLEQMEDMGVIPDGEFQSMIELTFGRRAFPMRKFMRMLYWMPKFKNLSPWPLPEVMPDASLELAKLAVERITSVDLTTSVVVYDAMSLPDATDPTWIVSGQSAAQQKLIEELPADRPVYVEGAFRVWLQRCCVNYFILRSEPKLRPKVEKDIDDVGFLDSMLQETYTETQMVTVPTVHEQEDGVILACCATGTSSRDSVVSWVRFLEQTNPRLGKDISVLFTLKSPLGPTDHLEIGDGQDGVSQPKTLEKPEYHKLGNLPTGVEETDLANMGIGEFSDTKFVNWPHHDHTTNVNARLSSNSSSNNNNKNDNNNKKIEK